MRALIKNSKKILVSQIDPSERALIDEFIKKSTRKYTNIKELYDIENELDGVSFTLAGDKTTKIKYKEPDHLFINNNMSISVNLKVDNSTTITVYPDENPELNVLVDENKNVIIEAKDIEELYGKALSYIVSVNLEKPGYGSTLVPIDVTVLYAGSNEGTMDYEDLDNLPSINNVKLSGNKSFSDLGLHAITDNQINNLFN